MPSAFDLVRGKNEADAGILARITSAPEYTDTIELNKPCLENVYRMMAMIVELEVLSLLAHHGTCRRLRRLHL